MHVQNFAKKCSKLKILLHVSTAYVNGTRAGVIAETPIHMGEALAGAKVSYVDINTEKEIVEEKLRELEALNLSQKEITSVMKDLGFERARLHGWPNTYVFTKAMGEMLLEETKEIGYKAVILRPTIITSTYREPFPGWVQGLRTLDALFAVHGKAKTTFFIGDPQSTIDIVPGDMVVNSMVAAVAKHSNQSSNHLTIYHVGSSTRNPISYKDILSLMYHYLLQHPFLDDGGKPIKMLKFLNVLCCDIMGRSYTNSRRALDHVMRLAEVYKPYLFFQGIFDDANTEGLRVATRQQDSDVDDMFGFDPKCIPWEEYFMNTHFPGIVKYSLK
ncbi:UNVERIFIED_CONTAM: Alcohol-forming fatty acyl-CoA reductase [Sesamum radiatum]|uniref:Fatty acyl-CoA reductase n=1 Tax=Sesamum radiatum TaxID=300843 RepID=A0AAW2W4I8_SESRA